MLTYRVTDGELTRDGLFLGTGYSGLEGEARNNPEFEQCPDVGPIPRGDYYIGDAYHSSHCGALTFDLEPLGDTDTFGRSEFRIHGDNMTHNASHGCIILGPSIRLDIEAHKDELLRVI